MNNIMEIGTKQFNKWLEEILVNVPKDGEELIQFK